MNAEGKIMWNDANRIRSTCDQGCHQTGSNQIKLDQGENMMKGSMVAVLVRLIRPAYFRISSSCVPAVYVAGESIPVAPRCARSHSKRKRERI